MTQIDWSKAPEWANAVVRCHDSQTMYFVEQFGGFSERRQMVESGQDDGIGADMIHPHNLILIEQRPWTGSGLPPVGTVCEWRGPNSDGPNGWVYAESKVVAYTEDGLFVCMQAPSCWPVVQRIDNCEFRPIRTPAQLAAEEREKAIEDMWSVYWQPDVPTAKAALGLLWDAGYRKVEVKP